MMTLQKYENMNYHLEFPGLYKPLQYLELNCLAVCTLHMKSLTTTLPPNK